MGGTVNFEPSTQAADTSARLQQAQRSGVPVLIPGALEKRAGPVEAAEVIADPAAAYARAAAVFDRVRLAREPEGGGAPSNQTAGRFRRILARLWRRVLRGADAAADVVV
jgi:hypothetical protein